MPKNHEPLSVLNTRLRIQSEKRDELKSKIREYTIELGAVEKKVQHIEGLKNKLLTKHIEISDHAIVRYQERVELLPTAEVKEKILNPTFVKIVDTLGPDGQYPIHDNVFAVVSSRKVTTIIVR